MAATPASCAGHAEVHEFHEPPFISSQMRMAARLPHHLLRRSGFDRRLIKTFSSQQEIIMAWTTPAATDLRFGFEITMYIANR